MVATQYCGEFEWYHRVDSLLCIIWYHLTHCVWMLSSWLVV